jgi:hypothetical protein
VTRCDALGISGEQHAKQLVWKRDRTNPDAGFRFFNSDCEHTLGFAEQPGESHRAIPEFERSNFTFSNPQWMHEELSRNIEYRNALRRSRAKAFFQRRRVDAPVLHESVSP